MTSEEDFANIRLKPVSKPSMDRFPWRYRIHQYWARKPWYVVRWYIEHFTKEGDTVLDPFVGSGVTACESLITRRKVIASDINPMSTFITRVSCLSPISIGNLITAYKLLEGKVDNEINKLYETTCDRCKNSATIITSIWEKNTPKCCFYHCKSCGYKKTMPYNAEDLRRVAKIEKMRIPFWYPRDVSLPEDSDVKFLDELFTKRNLIALSILFNEIHKEKDPDIRDLFMIMFSSTVTRTSKLIFVNRYRLQKGINPAGVWGEKRFWVPEEYAENNVSYYFKARINKVVKAKEETNSLIGTFYKENDTFRISTQSVTDLYNIPDESIDYCFTDPPYGGSVQYLGLSTFWNAWFQFSVDSAQEITINGHKTLEQYEEALSKAFAQIYRVLKRGHFLSITFHSSNVKVWNTMIRSCQKAGFELVDVVAQEPIKKTLSQIELKGTVDTDLIVTLRKPNGGKYVVAHHELPEMTQLVFEVAKEYLTKKEPASTSDIYDAILLKWISIAYSSTDIPKKLNLSINDLVQILKNMNFEYFEKTEFDYKESKRHILMWKLPTNSA